ncbi:MAG: hypothetical protein E5V57_07585, partial [Mesorhizobium sp.]
MQGLFYRTVPLIPSWHGSIGLRIATRTNRDGSRRPRLRADAEGAEETSEYDLKVERMQVDLEAAKINLERLKETTVDKEEARRAIRSLMRVFRAAMLNFANRYASDIAAEVEADPV